MLLSLPLVASFLKGRLFPQQLGLEPTWTAAPVISQVDCGRCPQTNISSSTWLVSYTVHIYSVSFEPRMFTRFALIVFMASFDFSGVILLSSLSGMPTVNAV